MNSLQIEYYFLWALISVPFVFASYGYINLIKTWDSYKNVECTDPTNGASFYTPLAFAIPAILPSWYGVAAVYLVGAFVVTLGNGKCFFVQNTWYRYFTIFVALFSLLMATWGNGDKGFIVIIGMGLFMLLGNAISKRANQGNE